LGKEHDPAAITGLDARDSIRKEALEVVRTGGTSAIEGQSDRRALLVGVGRTVSLLASVLGLGSESYVQACNEVLRGCRVVAGRGEAGCEFAQGVVSAEVGADSGETGLLGVGVSRWVIAMERDGGELTRQVGMPCWAATVWRTARPVRKSLNAIASSVWWSESGVWEDVVVMSERTAEREDVLMMDNVWMCWGREESRHEEAKMQEYILS
jgi:hypothetical protein